MEKVLIATLQEAIEDLGSPENIAEQALGHVAQKNKTLQHAVTKTKERLIDRVANLSTEALAETDAVAESAQERIGEKHEALLKVQDTLRKRLLKEIARRSTSELANTESVALKARDMIDDEDNTIVHGKNALKAHLIMEIADRSLEEMGDAKATADRAKALIDDEHASILGAVDELKQHLIEEIARRSTEALGNTQATAKQAMALISKEQEDILKAINKLKEQILQTIVQESLSKISDEVGTSLLMGSLSPAPPQPKTPAKSSSSKQAADARGPVEPKADSNGEQNVQATPPTAHLRKKMAANGEYLMDESMLAAADPIEVESLLEGTDSVYYVHGVVAHPKRSLGHTLAELETMYPARLLSFDSVGVIVSPIPLDAFNDKEENEQIPAVQEHILEQVTSAGYAVLPMYSSLVHPSDEHLRNAVTSHLDALNDALNSLSGKQEWNIKIYCDREKVRREVQTHDKTVESFLEQFSKTVEMWSERGSDAEVEAMKEGMEIPLDEVIETILCNCEERCHRLLNEISDEDQVVPVSKDSVFGNSSMILNASYLVLENQGETFRTTLEGLATEHENLGLVYYVGGPHAPCHFTQSATPTL
ncbi:MAG: GvpL/GvpF family gas vesicle protein [Rhodothermales bacterium]